MLSSTTAAAAAVDVAEAVALVVVVVAAAVVDVGCGSGGGLVAPSTTIAGVGVVVGAPAERFKLVCRRHFSENIST